MPEVQKCIYNVSKILLVKMNYIFYQFQFLITTFNAKFILRGGTIEGILEGDGTWIWYRFFVIESIRGCKSYGSQVILKIKYTVAILLVHCGFLEQEGNGP